ncbi:MAG TPA: hypothetical protein VE445_01100 [Nitrososphaeraceae archaeon]|jgi:hypothetical protein|nr:hypothetical protein [Nitrososphaeraceae archaeon]
MKKNDQKSKQRKIKSACGAFALSSFVLLLLSSIDPVIVFSQVEGQDTEEIQREPVKIIEDIQVLLNKILDEYKAQNYTGAEELATVAYLENYEYVEAPLAEKNEELMEETEIMLREDLSTAIEEKAPVEQVQQLINNINGNLDQAKQLFLETSAG